MPMPNPVESSPPIFPGVKIGANSYLPIPVRSIVAHPVVDFNVYIRVSDSMVLYLDKDLPDLHTNMVRRLLTNDVEVLYINSRDQQAYLRYLSGDSGPLVPDHAPGLADKSQLLYLEASQVAAALFEGEVSEDKIALTAGVIRGIVDEILKSRSALFSLMRLMEVDYQIFSHSVHVCVYSVGLGRQVAPNEPDFLVDLGQAALLHDLGKRQIDHAILNKPGPLSPLEWQVMKLHPTLGIQELQGAGSLSDVVTDVVVHHHEHCDGSGYPSGLSKDEISLASRIVAIADVYDALVSDRVYRKGYPPFKALSIMKEEMTRHLDGELFRHFVLMLGGN